MDIGLAALLLASNAPTATLDRKSASRGGLPTYAGISSVLVGKVGNPERHSALRVREG
jgi:hypothetical protein